MKHNNSPQTKQLVLSIVIILFITCLLFITTYALFEQISKAENNYFKTGIVEINLNDGKPIIEKHEYIFEPGMTVEKDFFIQNESTWAVYYKIYLDNVEGDLANAIEVSILHDNEVLYTDKAINFTRENAPVAKDVLLIDERRNLKIRFHYPKDASNDFQNQYFAFDLCADAVQEKNNPDKKFN